MRLENRTLMDLIRSMVGICQSPESVSGEVLKKTAYILNKFLSKLVPKTTFELWIASKQILNHFWVWAVHLKLKSVTQITKLS